LNATDTTRNLKAGHRPASQPPEPTVITRLHQKPIPDDGYYLTSSCVMGTFLPAVEPLVTRIYDLLGRRWEMGGTGAASLNTCCSGIVSHGNVFTIESSMLVVARLWSLCAEVGLENITTTCVTSFAIHNEILELLHGEPAWPRSWTRRYLVPAAAGLCSPVTSSTAATSSTDIALSWPV